MLVSLSSLPLFPSFLSCSSLPWFRGQGTLYFAVLALVFLCSHLYQNWCPGQVHSTWLEGVDPPDSTVKAAGCLCYALDGGLVCLALCYHPVTTKNQGPSNPRTTYVLVRVLIITACFNKKLKNVSCEYDRLNGGNSTLQAAWYIRHVRIIWFLWTKRTIRLLKLSFTQNKVRACSMFYPYEGYRSVTPLDAARVNRTIFHNHSVH